MSNTQPLDDRIKYLSGVSGMKVTVRRDRKAGQNFFEFYGPGGNVVNGFFDYKKAKAYAQGVAYGIGVVRDANDLKYVIEVGSPRRWWRLWFRKWEPMAFAKTKKAARDLSDKVRNSAMPHRIRPITYKPGAFV